ncbi:MAG: MlaA family lipoprotein [Candidatus Gastranaerophilaceae bacterium]
MKNKTLAVFIILCCFCVNGTSYASDLKYPDYAYEFLGEDKWENFNRRMFNFNLGLNKYALRPVHILWSSVMPEYGMDRIHSATKNIEYPIRLISSLIQKDFAACKTETIRFFTNTVLGLGGMYDPAKTLFNIEPVDENMEQALAGCKMQAGKYLVLPILSFTGLRGILGKVLDVALNPGSYIATPVLAIVKAGLMINKSSYLQPIIRLVEDTYADPYTIAKQYYALETYLKCANFDRLSLKDELHVPIVSAAAPVEETKKVPESEMKVVTEKKKPESFVKIEVSSEILNPELLKGGTSFDDILKKNYSAENFKLGPDIFLLGYNPQSPVIDSLRTSLFDLPGVDESVWNELSIWNRSFSKKIKSASIPYTAQRQDYKFRYLLQKDKSAPVAIIYPSIGEGVMASHSVLLAKIFYDKGYSIIIQGSHFQWEFLKSMPSDYRPGLPSKDAFILRDLTSKAISFLENKYNCKLGDKVFIGTSFGALCVLYIADMETRDNVLGNTKYIAICPPVELTYAMKQFDKNSEEWNKSSENFKQRVAQTAAKILKVQEFMDTNANANFEINYLPFSEDEAKLITGFVMHQKLSDLIFTLENAPKCSKCDIYKQINRMNYQDYAKKYLLSDEDCDINDLNFETSLHYISDYLKNNNNYKIYHSINDYLVSQNQLKQLKQYADDKMILLDNGAHLGFLYREEFIEDLKQTIASYKQ